MKVKIPYQINKDRNLLHILQVFLASKSVCLDDLPNYMDRFRSGLALEFDVREDNIELTKAYLDDMNVKYEFFDK